MEDNTKYTAKTMFGLEEVLANELKQLGAKNIEQAARAVHFEGDKELLYRANFSLRTALHIYSPIVEFSAFDKRRLYKKTKEQNWEKYIKLDQTFAIDSVVNSKFHKHSMYASLVMKDAIVDYFYDKYDQRPSVDIKNPDVRFHLHIDDQKVLLSNDSSGKSLHKRGYREKFGEDIAPVNEVLAAGMIMLTSWRGETDFWDPMCGSATIPIEAYRIASNTPSQINREYFTFTNWDDFDSELWEKVKRDEIQKMITPKINIYGSDMNQNRLEHAQGNAKAAQAKIIFENKDFFQTTAPSDKGVIVMNPPYGERLPIEEIRSFYHEIGDQFKTNCAGWIAWMISSNMSALKNVGLRPSRKIKLFNGALECRFQKYELYKGSKKTKYAETT